MATSIEWAWAAGLFEGEGCITVQHNRNRDGSLKRARTVVLKLQMTDRDVVERFADVVGCGSIVEQRQDRRSPTWKTMYRWQVASRDQVIEVLLQLVPHFGERRRAKALEAADLLGAEIEWSCMSHGKDVESGRPCTESARWQ